MANVPTNGRELAWRPALLLAVNLFITFFLVTLLVGLVAGSYRWDALFIYGVGLCLISSVGRLFLSPNLGPSSGR